MNTIPDEILVNIIRFAVYTNPPQHKWYEVLLVSNRAIIEVEKIYTSLCLVSHHFNAVTRATIPLDFRFNFPFRWAAMKGYVDVLQYFITLPGVGATACNSDAFVGAAVNGHIDVLRYLMTIPGINPSSNDNVALILAASNGHIDVLHYLVSLPEVNPTVEEMYLAIRAAIRNDHRIIAIFLLSLKGGEQAEQVNKLTLRYAVKKGYLYIVNMIKDLPRLESPNENNKLFKYAACNGNIELLEIVTSFKDIDEETYDDVFWDSAVYGRVDVLKFLIKLTHLSHDDVIFKFYMAACSGDLEEILSLPVDPNASEEIYNGIFIITSSNGYLEVLKTLVYSGEYEPSTEKHSAFQLAALHNHVGVVMFLVECCYSPYPGTNQYMYTLNKARKRNNTEIVELLESTLQEFSSQ